MSADLNPLALCCGGLLALGVGIWLVRKGFDLVVGCVGQMLVIAVAAILLTVFLTTAEADICQVWLVGEVLCAIIQPT